MHTKRYVCMYIHCISSLEVHASVSLGMVGRQLIGCYVALGSAEKKLNKSLKMK